MARKRNFSTSLAQTTQTVVPSYNSRMINGPSGKCEARLSMLAMVGREVCELFSVYEAGKLRVLDAGMGSDARKRSMIESDAAGLRNRRARPGGRDGRDESADAGRCCASREQQHRPSIQIPAI